MAEADQNVDEVIIDCVAHEGGTGGESYQKKNKFRCTFAKGAKRFVKLLQKENSVGFNSFVMQRVRQLDDT